MNLICFMTKILYYLLLVVVVVVVVGRVWCKWGGGGTEYLEVREQLDGLYLSPSHLWRFQDLTSGSQACILSS